MDEHGLTGWTLTFGEARKRLGACRFRHHVIWISRTHALEGSAEQLLDTVLHEIAHAIADTRLAMDCCGRQQHGASGQHQGAKTYKSQTS